MTNLINSLAGVISLLVSLAGMVYLIYYSAKNGFKVFTLIIGFFALCILTYFVKNPGEIPTIGGAIVGGIKSVVKGWLICLRKTKALSKKKLIDLIIT